MSTFTEAQEGQERAPDGRLVQQVVPRYLLFIEEATHWPLRWGATVMDRNGFILNRIRESKEPYVVVIQRCGHRHKTKVAAVSCGRVLFRRTVAE